MSAVPAGQHNRAKAGPLGGGALLRASKFPVSLRTGGAPSPRPRPLGHGGDWYSR